MLNLASVVSPPADAELLAMETDFDAAYALWREADTNHRSNKGHRAALAIADRLADMQATRPAGMRMKIKALRFLLHAGFDHIGPTNDIPEYAYEGGHLMRSLWADVCEMAPLSK